MDCKALLETPAYGFLRTHPRLGGRVILLGLSGSYGYGTNREGSDIDFRGVTLSLPSDLLGLTSFEQFEDRATDTVVYSFNKLVGLLLNCNPSAIELLGLDRDQYPILTPLGQALLDNRALFLSRRAADSFGRFADAQLRRLENAVARGSLPQAGKEQHILRSLEHAMEDFNRRHQDWNRGSLRLYIDQAETPGLDQELYLDAALSRVPLRRFQELTKTMGAIVRDYDKTGKRGQKDDNHLDKHAMHMIRLYLMGIDLLERGEIRTHRPESDLTLLRRIRNGDFRRDGAFVPEYYQLVEDCQRRFRAAVETTALPEQPDLDRVEAFVEQVNRQAIEEGY